MSAPAVTVTTADALFVLRDTGETVGLFPLICSLKEAGRSCVVLVSEQRTRGV